jgi:hypothetical protein
VATPACPMLPLLAAAVRAFVGLTGTFGRQQGRPGPSERQLARRAQMLNLDGQATAMAGTGRRGSLGRGCAVCLQASVDVLQPMVWPVHRPQLCKHTCALPLPRLQRCWCAMRAPCCSMPPTTAGCTRWLWRWTACAASTRVSGRGSCRQHQQWQLSAWQLGRSPCCLAFGMAGLPH